MNQPILWYASRATGLLTLVLFTGSVVLGALGGGRFANVRWPRFTLAALHRNVSLLAVVFLVVHITTATVDPYAGIGWLDAIVPFRSAYSPFWLGLGAVATDLTIAVVVTSLLRPRVNVRLWRYVHWASYALWPLAVAHGIGTTIYDFRMGWVAAIDVLCVLAVLAAVGRRIATRHPDTVVRAGAVR
ncbi:MAG TPA: ferric reductase-like transmembrane domain-containing protein [Pseudonocardiaceae bacterium]|jgi:predicted ferric reductase|nr:ferric reductase-like transmembrane domain-containing protein [Pseudonocardiaceae bacterium]